MILDLVTFNSPAGWNRARVAEGAGTGVYISPSIEAAQKAHDEAGRAAVRKRTGDAPTIRCSDLFLRVDNAEIVVTEFAADGSSRRLAPA